jgi:hypothetical protein
MLVLSALLSIKTVAPSVDVDPLAGGLSLVAAVGLTAWLVAERRTPRHPAPVDPDPSVWTMPPLETLARPGLSPRQRVLLAVLRVYLLVAAGALVVRVVQMIAS